jgi:hypothetical protein
LTKTPALEVLTISGLGFDGILVCRSCVLPSEAKVAERIDMTALGIPV